MLLIVVVSPSAGAVESSAAVRNLAPTILGWEASVDETAGLFHYRVVAYDGNGEPDLSRLAFYVIRESDGRIRDVQYFEDQQTLNMTAAEWQGVLVAKGAPYAEAHRVELHVVDVNQGRAVERVPYRTLDRVVDEVDATQQGAQDGGKKIPLGHEGDRFPTPFGTFTERVETTTPLGVAGLLTLLLATLALVGAVTAIHLGRPRDVPEGVDGVDGAPARAPVVQRIGGRRRGSDGRRPRP